MPGWMSSRRRRKSPSAWRQVVASLRDEDKTPLVQLLLQVIEEQAQRIAALEAEIAHLKGGSKKPASNSKPSALSKPAIVARRPTARRPGSEKRSKTKDLPITRRMPMPPKELPPGSTFLRRDPFVVQDLIVERTTPAICWRPGERRRATADPRRTAGGNSRAFRPRAAILLCSSSITRLTFRRAGFSRNCATMASTFRRDRSTTF